MNLATVLGIPVGIGLLLVAFMIEGGNPASLILPSPLIIIFGGTFGALLTGYDLSDVLSIPKLIGDAMRMPPTKEKDLALRFVALAEKSRRDGLFPSRRTCSPSTPRRIPSSRRACATSSTARTPRPSASSWRTMSRSSRSTASIRPRSSSPPAVSRRRWASSARFSASSSSFPTSPSPTSSAPT